MGQLHLKPTFPRTGAFAEDLQDESCPVEHLGAPGLFEVPLLHRGQRGVDDDDFRLEPMTKRLDLINLAAAYKRRGGRLRDGRDQAFFDLKSDRGGESYGLFKTRFFAPAGIGGGLSRRMDDDRRPRLEGRVATPLLRSLTTRAR